MGARVGIWRPLGPQTQAKMRQVDIICLHTMVGSLAGTDRMFLVDGYGGLESHFGVGGGGTIYQWQDTDYVAEANLNGNWHLISIETEDRNREFFPDWDANDGRAVPAWTDAQIESIARIVAECCRVHDIPCELIPDSKPGRRGIGYHRQGVPGFVVAGGELWSSAKGKVCPGDRRIGQIPRVIARARELLSGDDMFSDADRATLNKVLANGTWSRNQILKAIGVDPELSPDEISRVIASRDDLGWFRDQVMKVLGADGAKAPADLDPSVANALAAMGDRLTLLDAKVERLLGSEK